VVSEVLSECPGVAVAYAFGARATGSALPSSDLDLAFVLSDEAKASDDPLLAERLAARIATRLRNAFVRILRERFRDELKE
jgi:predicted nucleotidyltransferase